jgi:dienelactone hydrolase
MKQILVLAVAILLPATVMADIHTEVVEYTSDGAVLEGFLAYDKNLKGKQPGVIVVPDWQGLRSFYQEITKKLAGMGYIAFAADIYGKGIRPATGKEAAVESNKYKSDRKLMRKRVQAALEELKKVANVDLNRIAAIGYCFGGTVVLELARSGADIKGVVSFHGGLSTPTPNDAKNIKAKVLALHGADDPYAPPKEVAAFQDEMRNAGVDWHMIIYGDAVHAFTNPAAGADKSKGVAYNEKADKRSWKAMKSFFEEIF